MFSVLVEVLVKAETYSPESHKRDSYSEQCEDRKVLKSNARENVSVMMQRSICVWLCNLEFLSEIIFGQVNYHK